MLNYQGARDHASTARSAGRSSLSRPMIRPQGRAALWTLLPPMFWLVLDVAGPAEASAGSLRKQRALLVSNPVLHATPLTTSVQLQKMEKQTASALSEYDAIKDHLSDYITANAPLKTPARPARSNATRHISHLTQMAAKALNRPLPSKYGSTPRVRTISGLSSGSDKSAPRDKSGWDELVEYPAKRSWRSVPQIEEEGVRLSRLDSAQGCNAQASLDSTWSLSQLPSRSAGNTRPQCVQLQTKLTKRCPHPNCRHLLIQPDTKSVRMKIKMVARSYLPEIEIGRRRRRTTSGDYGMTGNLSQDELERRRRERRRTRAPTKEEDQDLDEPILAGAVVSLLVLLRNG